MTKTTTSAPVQASPETMKKILAGCGLALSETQVRLLWRYHQALRAHNVELNLTRVHNFANMVIKLYADSMLPGTLATLPSPLLDIGTGPGMPGIPLKILLPDLELVLAESRGKRADFLREVVATLGLEGVTVVDRSIGPHFEQPVSGIITRAVEEVSATLQRVTGCLAQGGLAVFMKGPNCDEEIARAVERHAGDYELVEDRAYRIARTDLDRRLVLFRRLTAPPRARKAMAMERHRTHVIASAQNDTFIDLKKLLTGRGIRKQGRAVLAGARIVSEALERHPERCLAWITHGSDSPPPDAAPEKLGWIQLAPDLFRELDQFGTGAPLLLIETRPIPAWNPEEGLPEGPSLLLPFQDPENLGTAIRSAVAFGIEQVILLAESANPYHPKSLRASGGTVLDARFLSGPSIRELPAHLPLVPLSAEGADIAEAVFPATFAFLPGVEGPGIPDTWRHRAVAIPISPGVESLNAATAIGIALYVWSRSRASRIGKP